MRIRNIKRTAAFWSLTAGAFALTATATQGATVDLATGNSGEVNGALFVWTDTQPTGTGYIDPFVRIQGHDKSGIEQGYNTSGRPFAFDEKEPANYTHDVQVKDLGAGVNVNGVDYYQFLLDVNEPGGRKSNISLDSLKLFTSDTGSKTTADVDSLGTLRYDLGNNWILLDASRNSGSGSGDMYAYIPKSLFAGANGDDYLYFYSKFGAAEDGTEAEAGFEEWAYLRHEGGGTTGGTSGGTTGGTTGGSTGGTTGGPSPVPEPSTYALLGGLLAMAGWMKIRQTRAA